MSGLLPKHAAAQDSGRFTVIAAPWASQISPVTIAWAGTSAHPTRQLERLYTVVARSFLCLVGYSGNVYNWANNEKVKIADMMVRVKNSRPNPVGSVPPLLSDWTSSGTLLLCLLLSAFACFANLRSEGAITSARFRAASSNRSQSIQREFEAFARASRASRSFLSSSPQASATSLERLLDQIRSSPRLKYGARFESPARSFRIDQLQIEWPLIAVASRESAKVFPCDSSQKRFCLAITGPVPSQSGSGPEGQLTLVAAIADLVEEAVSYLKPHGVEIELFAAAQPVYRHVSRMRAVYKNGPLESLRGSPEFITEHWTFAGENWSLALSSVPGYLSAAATFQPWIVFSCGVAISFFLAWARRALVRHTHLVERTVEIRTQELKSARDEALAASVLKSRFLANVSHEIRTPLNGVLGMAQFLLESRLDSEQREYARTIQQSGELLLHLINDLLDLSKIEAGSIVLAQETLDLANTIQIVFDILSEPAYQKGLKLELALSQNIPRYLCGDSLRMRQILLNLMNNAVKFTSSGHVRLMLSRHLDQTICFSVQDSGPGIPPELLDKLFQRFMMGDNSSARRHSGAGLGLAISRELVERMGGRIWVENEVSAAGDIVGATFSFTLPILPTPNGAEDLLDPTHIPPPLRFRAAKPESTAHSAELPTQIDSTVRVLVVEDNIVNQRVTLGMLRKLGYQADVANDGREAVDAYLANSATKPYDLILMDCQMPEMDGFQATLAIRQAEDGRSRVPIVALTANVMLEDRQHCLDSQMDDHLAKPLSLNALNSVLQKWVGSGVLQPD